MKNPALSTFAPRRLVIAAVVLLLSLGVTGLAWRILSLSQKNAAARSFEEITQRLEGDILDRTRGFEQALRSAAGLFAAANHVNRDDWRRYVAASRVSENSPGVRGLHYAPRIVADALAGHVAAVRREGFPDYTLRPAGERAEYFPVLWPEPFDDRNRSVMGFDMFSDPVRREAMQRARDSGKPTISAKLKLAGEGKEPVAGFVYYFPIYSRDLPAGSVEERRRALIGFVICPVRVPDMMNGLINGSRDLVDVEVYDGAPPSAESLMFDDDGVPHALEGNNDGKLWAQRELKFGDHRWTLHFEASQKFIASIDASGPRWMLVAGLLISLIVTGLIWRLLTSEALAQSASLHDGLTGLYNRRFLEASLKREEDRARRMKSSVSVVLFDLDHFKRLNDEYGHGAGDEVLRRVAEVLRSATRGEDFVCRYGGEEFTLILPGAKRDDAVGRAKTIGKHIATLRMSLAGQPLPRVTISGGVASFPEDGASLADALRRADHALLRAKREGRARILIARDDDPTTSMMAISVMPGPQRRERRANPR